MLQNIKSFHCHQLRALKTAGPCAASPLALLLNVALVFGIQCMIYSLGSLPAFIRKPHAQIISGFFY